MKRLTKNVHITPMFVSLNTQNYAMYSQRFEIKEMCHESDRLFNKRLHFMKPLKISLMVSLSE